MEIFKINMMADSRNSKIVDGNLQPITGLVTLFKDVPVLIELALFSMDGKPYDVDTLNSYEWGFVIANDYNNATIPQLRASSVTVAENVLKIELKDMNTVELNNELKDEKSIRFGAELNGKKDGVDNWVIQFNISIRNRRESSGVPTNVAINYYTKPEVDEKLENINPDLSDYYTKGEVDDLIIGVENAVTESFDTTNHIEGGTLTFETEGRILQVVDNNGKAVLADIEFVEINGKLFSIITATGDIEGFWTIYKIIGALQFTELDLTPYLLKSDVEKPLVFGTGLVGSGNVESPIKIDETIATKQYVDNEILSIGSEVVVSSGLSGQGTTLSPLSIDFSLVSKIQNANSFSGKLQTYSFFSQYQTYLFDVSNPIKNNQCILTEINAVNVYWPHLYTTDNTMIKPTIEIQINGTDIFGVTHIFENSTVINLEDFPTDFEQGEIYVFTGRVEDYATIYNFCYSYTT